MPVTASPVPLTRRQLLRGSAATALALAAGTAGVRAQAGDAQLGPAKDIPQPAPPVVGFAGPDVLQLEIVSNVLSFPPITTVGAEDVTAIRRVANTRIGLPGTRNGVSGQFSGSMNTSAAQIFRPWPYVREETIVPSFDPLSIGSSTGVSTADQPGNWRILTTSPAPIEVKDVFRKSVPAGIARVSTDAWSVGRRHLVSLSLSRPVTEGEVLEIRPPGLPPLTIERTAATPSAALHWCHAGYAAVGPKRAYAGLWLGENREGRSGNTDQLLSAGRPWRLIDEATGDVAMAGVTALAKAGTEPHAEMSNFNGCDIWEADFSAVSRPGTYRVEVDGVGATEPFAIAPDPYREVARSAARWYFHQRSGIAISATEGEGRTRPRNGHPDDGLRVFKTDIQLGRTSEGFLRTPSANQLMAEQPTGGATVPEAWGGWHDAGDWDRRIQHMDAVYTIAEMVERFPAVRSLDLNIPESGLPFADPKVAAKKSAADLGDGRTVLPDLVHEALWGISLWRRTQASDGGIIGGVEYSSDGISGSVSWNPIQSAFAYSAEEWASYRFAEAAAKLGHVVRHVCGDTALGSSLIDEALAAWQYAENAFSSRAGELSGNEGAQVTRARVAASGPLYRATGLAEARSVFEDLNPFAPRKEETADKTGRADAALAALDYVRAGDEGLDVDPEIAGDIANWCRYAAIGRSRMGRDYGVHATDEYPWGIGWARFGPGSNWRARRIAIATAAGLPLDGDVADAVLEGLWFALGCNPSNVSFIQGFGVRDFEQVTNSDLERVSYPPGTICFGVAAGPLRRFEYDRILPALFPRREDSWPRYARIFECSSAIICAEHGMKSNAMEWLLATGMAHQILADRNV